MNSHTLPPDGDAADRSSHESRSRDAVGGSEAAALPMSILDALPAHIALVDGQGEILAVNESWRRFASANMLQGPKFAVGQNYLQVCETAAGDCSEGARAAAEGIRQVLRGELPEFALEYPCHSPTEPRWFRMMATPLRQDHLSGAAIMHVNITQRKLAELTLMASEASMAAAQRIAHFGSWELDLADTNQFDANPLRWSDEMFRIAGFEPGSVAVSNDLFFRLVPPEDHARIRHAVEMAIHEGGTYSIIHRLVRPDGEERFIHEVAQVTSEEKTGRPLRMIGTAHDITEQRKTEEALRRGEAEQRQLARQLEAERARLAEAQRVAKMGSWETDLTTLAVLWSEETHQIFETDAPNVCPTHASFLDLVHPEDRAMVDAAFVRSQEQPGPGLIRHRLLLPGGQIKYVEERWQIFTDEAGRAIRALGTCQDVTEQKLAEEALLESEARFRGTFEQAAVGIAHVSVDGRFLRVNDKLCAIIGHPREELLEMTFLELTVPEDRAGGLEAQRAMLAGERSAFTTEKRYRHREGHVVWVKLVTTLERTAAGEPKYFISVFADITTRKLAEFRLHRLNRLHTVLSKTGEAAVRSRAPQDLYERLCRIVVEDGLLRMALVVELDAASGSVRQVASYGEGLEYLVGLKITMEGPLSLGTIGTALRTGTHDFCNDYTNDPRMAPWRDRALHFGFLAGASIPLKLGEVTIGALVLFSAEAGYFEEDELRLMTAVAGNISFALDGLRKEKEQRLAEAEARRTADLLRAVADGTPDAVFLKDLQGRYLLFNEAAARFVGKPIHEVLGRDDTALFSPEDARVVMESDRYVVESNHARTAEEVLTAAGATRTYLVTKAPHRDAEGTVIGLIGISRDITERKDAEQRLKAMSDRLASTLESLTDGFFTLNDSWRFTYVNREAERMFQIPRSELVGAHIWEKFPEARGTVSQEEYERAARERVAVQFETFYAPLGMWFEARAFPTAEGLAVYFRDITANRAADAKIRESEERLRLLASATKDTIWDWDMATDRIWWNEGYETMFGRRRDEVDASSRSWTDFIHPDDREWVLREVHAVIDGASDEWSGEYRFLRKDGAHAYVLDRGRVLRDAKGKAVRMIGGMTDLTERRRVEEKLGEQAALLDKAQDAILVRDLEYRITYWNRSAERLYGWSAQEVLGRSVEELLYLDQAPFLAATQAAMEKGEWIGELTKKTKDGRKLTIEGRWSLVRDDAGQPKCILAIDTDITERKKLEAQFLRAQRMESIGTLAGGIAHDLNNVLAPIMMSIDLLKMDLDPKERLEILTTIETSARRGADMVSQVLSFARGVEGRQIEIQVRHLLRDILKIVNETFLKSIVVRTSLPQDLWTLSGDPTQLHQVMLNLCVNARDAMPHGGTLSIAAENVMLDEHYAALSEEAKPGPHVMIQVEDTGTGIPPENITKIFDPFFTTKEVGKGTGLGLSTSLAIVRSHGGFLRVYSEPGHGTRFRVYLPALLEARAVTLAEEAAALPRGDGQLVLVVDDEASVRQITRQTLEAFGYSVLLACDGAEAVALYAEHRDTIAVVLTDMMMPVMDGPATIQVLLRLNPRLLIIAASGLNANGRVAKAANAGVKHFLPKPYTAETLLKILAEVLSRKT